MIRTFLCEWLPWHDLMSVSRRLSEQSTWCQCSCGREYAINHWVGAILPWEHVREFYEERERRRAAP